VVIPEPTALRTLQKTADSHSNLAEAVADRLAERILNGELASGTRLPAERQLCVDFGVSRIVVREALKALSERGLLEIRPGVGSFVTALDAAVASRHLSQYIQHRRIEPEHLFEIRRLLEPAMAAQAARNATPEIVQAMQVNLKLTQSAVERLEDSDVQIEAFAWADLDFHQLVATATGNPLYETVLSPLLDNLLDVRRRGVRVVGSARQALNDHRRIFERIAAGDSAGARRAMQDHIDAVQSWSEASLEDATEAPDAPPQASG